MTDEFLAFLDEMIATHEAERDKKYHGVSKVFANQQRLIAAGCVGALQSVKAKYEELTAPLYADGNQRRRVWSRAKDFAASSMSEIRVKQGEQEARLIVRHLEARRVAATAVEHEGRWFVRKERRKQMTEAEVVAKLKNGYHCCYAPISGGVVIVKGEHYAPIDTQVFLDLRASGTIRHIRTTKQGHEIFRGQVDIYKLSESEATND